MKATNKKSKQQATKNKLHDTSPLSRRAFIGAGVAGTAAVVGAANAAGPQVRARKRHRAPSIISTTGSEAYDPELVLLVNRTNYGFSLAEYQVAESMGYDAYLQQQLNTTPTDIDTGDFDPTLNARIGAYDILGMTVKEIRDAYNGMGATSSFIALRQACSFQIMLATYGEGQLFARTYELWRDHTNTDVNSETRQRWMMHPYNRRLMNATFEDFEAVLFASAQSGSMMHYLNQNESTVDNPNENYAREVMELHTLGVDNTYTEDDIVGASRVLTGWGFDNNQNNATFGEYRYLDAIHDQGTKTVIGQQYGPNGGEQEGIDLLNFLVGHEDTAEYVSRKMVRFFLGYGAPEDIVQYVKSVYLDTAGGTRPIGHIPTMVETILQRDVLTTYASVQGTGINRKFKRPLHYVASIMRATGAIMTPTATSFLDSSSQAGFALRSMGAYPHTWATPDGPFDSLAWAEGAVLARWAFADRLAQQNLGDTVDFNITNWLSQVGADASGEHGRGFSELLTGGQFDQKEVDDLTAFLGQNPGEQLLQEGLALALQMPSFQFY
jgi:uncharacterized protein (DUF1800 family)